MEEIPENGKGLLYSTRGKGMNEWMNELINLHKDLLAFLHKSIHIAVPHLGSPDHVLYMYTSREN